MHRRGADATLSTTRYRGSAPENGSRSVLEMHGNGIQHLFMPANARNACAPGAPEHQRPRMENQLTNKYAVSYPPTMEKRSQIRGLIAASTGTIGNTTTSPYTRILP
jgi:hypothetical protein